MTNYDEWAWLRNRLTPEEWRDVRALIEKARREGYSQGAREAEMDAAERGAF